LQIFAASPVVNTVLLVMDPSSPWVVDTFFET